MAKTKSKIAPAKTSEQREGNRYARAARVLAKDDAIDVKTLAHARSCPRRRRRGASRRGAHALRR
jgi:hypothetical protein